MEQRQIKTWNAVNIIVNGVNIYSLNIEELDFGGDGELDYNASNIQYAIQNAA